MELGKHLIIITKVDSDGSSYVHETEEVSTEDLEATFVATCRKFGALPDEAVEEAMDDGIWCFADGTSVNIYSP